jgi:hypothetical protein
MAIVIPRSRALAAASKRLSFKSEKSMETMLEFAAGSLSEAYRIGAEEAQSEIVSRLAALTGYSASTHPTKMARPGVSASSVGEKHE